MSPYRVLVDTGSSNCVMAAMLSVDKTTMTRSILITRKTVEGFSENDVSSKVVAHMQTGRRNSNILCRYVMTKEPDRSYSVSRVYYVSESGSLITASTGIHEFTQSDCLKAAMNNYCASNKLRILQDL